MTSSQVHAALRALHAHVVACKPPDVSVPKPGPCKGAKKKAANAVAKVAKKAAGKTSTAKPATTGPAARKPKASGDDQQAVVRAREQQFRIEGARKVAGVIGEIQELAAKGADVDLILEKVDIMAKLNNLESIGKVDEKIGFDPDAHRLAVGKAPAKGEPVKVIRAGFWWKPLGERILIERAVVAP